MNKLSIILTAMLLIVLSHTAWAGKDLTIVNGEHWLESSLEQKRSYLFGIGNMLEIEQAMAGENLQATRGKSIVPVLLHGLSNVSIADLVTQLDKFYQGHAAQIKRPVIEVLYVEMALPNMKN